MRKRVADYLVYLAVRVLICIVQAIPPDTAARLARGLARGLYALGVRRGVVKDNLRHAFPERSEDELRRLAVAMWEHLLLLAVEVANISRKVHETNWRRYVARPNVGPLIRTLISDRPTIILSGHFGNFEIGGYMLGLLGFPTYSIARPLDNPYLDRFVNAFRGETGQYMIPKNDSLEQIAAVMSAGGTMALLADQYAGPKGCWVEFFGRPASAHKAIGLLALEYDAPVMVSYARRTAGPLHFELAVSAAIDPRRADSGVGGVRELTQWYTSALEQIIRRNPEQYWWVHRRWKDTRVKRQASQAKAA